MNDDRLASCDAGFSVRVRAVIEELESYGFKPRIVESWRSPMAQRRAVASGRSLVTFGFHNIVGSRREPRAFAVDLVQSERATPTLNYAFRLAALAARHRLDTGILWGLSKEERDAVYKAMAKPRVAAPVKIGWDPCHLQPADMTVAQALEAAAQSGATPTFEGSEGSRGEPVALSRRTGENP
jgi:hypothetical protein